MFRNPRYASPDKNVIVLEVELEGEWTPFIARPSDVSSIGAGLFARAHAGEFGEVAAYVELPDPAPTNADVNAERDKRLHDGASFAVTGIADPIPLQGREADKSVYLAQLMRAQGMKAAGVTDPALRIRDAVNNIHWLTPDQMIELVSVGMAWFEDVMAVSWAMKDATGDFPDGIPSDLSNDAHWPSKEPTE
ncbi:hypothetical protein ACGYKD_11465 [Sulfitobacter sp. TB366]|uniref:DUF4376 domain-containing protein n=1 Tax=Sulfitobacter sp. TB366 TaxID=3368580 RepID=UPI003745BB51